MFNVNRSRTVPQTAFSMLLLIHENTVRSIRKEHSNAIIGLLMNIVQVLVMLAVFYLMVTLMGMRRTAIRGDFIVYLLSGIFIYQTNIRSVGAVASAEGPTSSMMLHAPMNMVISICSAAAGACSKRAINSCWVRMASSTS